MSGATGEHCAGCSKSPDFSHAQPWRLPHPPALSLPRQPLCPGTRLVPSKAAASYHFLRGGWDDPNCAQYSTHPALSAPRRALSRARAFPFPIPPFRGVAKAALNCAHRTSTVSPCAFCEQGGHLAAPSPPLTPVLLRPYNTPFASLTPWHSDGFRVPVDRGAVVHAD